MKNKFILIIMYVLMFLSLDLFSQAPCVNPVVINDPLVANADYNHALRLLDARCAWTITRGSRDIIVGVVDTEFDTLHEDLRHTFARIGGLGTNTFSHGTAVASCVATGTNNGIGIAAIGYNTRVNGYRVVSSGGSASEAAIWSAVYEAYRDGIKIINVSWASVGASRSQIQQMVNDGVVLVVAAGDNPSTFHQAYADIPGVINVSGVDATNHHGPTGNASNAWVDVCVLSRQVANCRPGNQYQVDQGAFTSFAAPQVAGVVALMRSVNPNLTPPQVENILKETTDRIPDDHLFLGNPKPGRVNAFRALRRTLCTLPSSGRTFSGTVTTDSIVNGNNVHISNNITVRPGGHLRVNACNSVTITSGNITVEPGGTLDISVYGP